jgi:hypothetical protein
VRPGPTKQGESASACYDEAIDVFERDAAVVGAERGSRRYRDGLIGPQNVENFHRYITYVDRIDPKLLSPRIVKLRGDGDDARRLAVPRTIRCEQACCGFTVGLYAGAKGLHDGTFASCRNWLTE